MIGRNSFSQEELLALHLSENERLEINQESVLKDKESDDGVIFCILYNAHQIIIVPIVFRAYNL